MEQQNNSYIFFDQNVRDKMSKNKYKSFQDNVNKLTEKRLQRLTAFGLIEFAELKKAEIFNVQYKGKKLNEYLFRSYEEIYEFIPTLKEKIYKKINKCFLKEKLDQKINKDSKYLSIEGFKCIDRYIKGIESIYEGLIDNLLLDRLSQINISKLSNSDKEKIVYLLICRIVEIVSVGRNMGALRLICKIFQERRGNIIEGEESKSIESYIINICRKLKSKGDLMDCELVHLAFFGSNNKHCHCYTTDDEETIMDRLVLYCKSIDHFIDWHFHENTNYNYRRPKWKCGKIFILDKNDGKQIKEICTTEIYEQVLNVRRRFTQ